MLAVTDVSDNDPERRYVINSACLSLGYLYIELSNYQMAMHNFLKIPSDFIDYPDVLLAKGWASLKSEEYQAGLDALNELIRKFPDYYNLEEAHFLRGQCYLKLGYNDFAIAEYDKVLRPEESDDVSPVFQTGMDVQADQLDSLDANLKALQSTLVKSIPLEVGDALVLSNGTNRGSVQATRRELISKIVRERQIYREQQEEMARLQKRYDQNELRKRWMTYAEYGKTRALFLKGMNAQ